MAIEEVPITQDDSQVETPHEDPPAVPAKKRGRPPGALNKKKPSIVEVPVEAPVEKKKRVAKAPPLSESEEEPPKPRKRARPRVPSSSDDEPPPKKRATRSAAPEPPTTQQLAAEVLQLLSNRHVGVANARRARYASWFE